MLLVVLYLISYRSLGLLLLFVRLLSVGVQSWSLYLDGELEAWPPVECAVQEKVLVPHRLVVNMLGVEQLPRRFVMCIRVDVQLVLLFAQNAFFVRLRVLCRSFN